MPNNVGLTKVGHVANIYAHVFTMVSVLIYTAMSKRHASWSTLPSSTFNNVEDGHHVNGANILYSVR